MNVFFLMLIVGALLWGASAGMLGVFMVLRRQSLVADALAHASLPGIVLAFLLTGSIHPLVLFFGACSAGAIALLFVLLIKQTTGLGYDALLGIVIALFYGSGIALLTFAQRFGGRDYSILSKFLLGNIALISLPDVILLCVIALLILGIGVSLWKELVLTSFDEDYARCSGYSVFMYDIVFALTTIVVVSTGMQIGGAVVTSALLVAPALTARYCSQQLSYSVIYAAIFGALATTLGCLVSYFFERMPAGPIAVCCATLFLIIVLMIKGSRNANF